LELLEDTGWSRGGNKYARLNSRIDVSARYFILIYTESISCVMIFHYENQSFIYICNELLIHLNHFSCNFLTYRIYVIIAFCENGKIIQLFSSGLDTSLQVLDARTLMKQQTYVSSTPGSSLDLEWEHEGDRLRIIISFPILIMY